MREYYLSFVTGGFALLGVIVSNLFHIQSMKRSQKLSRERKKYDRYFHK